MFTGIVEEVGRVEAVDDGELTIAAAEVLQELAVSDSICVNGVCLTVTETSARAFSLDVVPETLRRSNLGALTPGNGVNLERSLTPNGRMGGHIVQGHVDGTASVTSIEPDGEAIIMHFSAHPDVMRYVVEKGFICVDGTSLTIVDCGDTSFSITLIPYTRENTIFGSRRPGDKVNIEVDILAKYVERLLAARDAG